MGDQLTSDDQGGAGAVPMLDEAVDLLVALRDKAIAENGAAGGGTEGMRQLVALARTLGEHRSRARADMVGSTRFDDALLLAAFGLELVTVEGLSRVFGVSSEEVSLVLEAGGVEDATVGLFMIVMRMRERGIADVAGAGVGGEG